MKYLSIPADKIEELSLDLVQLCDECYYDDNKDIIIFVNPSPQLIKIIRSIFP